MSNEQIAGLTLLGGCRVLDLTDEKGFLCGKILGDYGADVIKIEPPGGDKSRNIGPFYQQVAAPEKSLYWFGMNTSKRGITLNIETKEGKDLFIKLCKTADFVIESFRPGYMDSLGLGYSALEKINPRIIMTSISPFGATGPYAQYEASDLTLWAMSGYLSLCGEPYPGRPYRTNAPYQSYLIGGAHAATGCIIAHYDREGYGEGQQVDVSLQEAMIAFLNHVASEAWDLNKIIMKRGGLGWVTPRGTPPGPLNHRWHYPCKDGYINFMFSGGTSGGFVHSTKTMVQWMEKDGLAGELKDYDWTKYDAAKVPQEEYNRIYEIFAKFFLTKTKKELYTTAVEKNMILTPLYTAKDLVEDPQLADREFFVKVNHPELKRTIDYPGAPVKLNRAPWRISRRAPLIGEHNNDVYVNELGLSSDKIAELKAANTI